MTCDKCPHLIEVRDALKRCHNCDNAATHTTVHIDEWKNKEKLLAKRKRDIAYEPQTGCTKLDPECENKFRIFLTALLSLSPLELLLIRHIVNGGRYATYEREMSQLAKTINTQHLSRLVVKRDADRLCARIPGLRRLLDDAIARNAGFAGDKTPF